MYFDDLIKNSYIKSEPPLEDEIVLLAAGCRPQVDYNLVVSKRDFEDVLMNNRAKDPTSEAVLMSIGRRNVSLGDPIWDIMLQRDSVVSRYTSLCNDATAQTLSDLEGAERSGLSGFGVGSSELGAEPSFGFQEEPAPSEFGAESSELGFQEEAASSGFGTEFPNYGAPAEEAGFGGAPAPEPGSGDLSGFGQEGELPAEEGSPWGFSAPGVEPQPAEDQSGFAWGVQPTEGFGLPQEPESYGDASAYPGFTGTPAGSPLGESAVPVPRFVPGAVNTFGIPEGEDGMSLYLDNPECHRAYEAEVDIYEEAEEAPAPGAVVTLQTEEGCQGAEPAAQSTDFFGGEAELEPQPAEQFGYGVEPQPAEQFGYGVEPQPAEQFGYGEAFQEGQLGLSVSPEPQPEEQLGDGEALEPQPEGQPGYNAGSSFESLTEEQMAAGATGAPAPQPEEQFGFGLDGFGVEPQTGFNPGELQEGAEPQTGFNSGELQEGAEPQTEHQQEEPEGGAALPGSLGMGGFGGPLAPLGEESEEAAYKPAPPAGGPASYQMYDVPGYTAPAPVSECAMERFLAPDTEGSRGPRPGFGFNITGTEVVPEEGGSALTDLGQLGQLVHEEGEGVPPRDSTREFTEPVPVEDGAPADLSAGNAVQVQDASASAPEPEEGGVDEGAMQAVRNTFSLFDSLVKQHTLGVILASESLTAAEFCNNIVTEFPMFTEQFEASLNTYGEDYDRATMDLVQSLQLEAESSVYSGDLDRAEQCVAPIGKLIYS